MQPCLKCFSTKLIFAVLSFMFFVSPSVVSAEDIIYSNPYPPETFSPYNSLDWDDVTMFGLDFDSYNPNLDNENNHIDYKNAGFAHDDLNLYMLINNHKSISEAENSNSSNGSDFSWAWQIYIDVDSDASTGFAYSDVIGADYLIEGSVIHEYQGDGSSWNWSAFPQSESNWGNFHNDKLYYSIPRSMIANPELIRIVFNGVNSAYGGDTTDIYPNGALGETGDSEDVSYFTYSLGKSAVENHAPIVYRQDLTIEMNNSFEFNADVRDLENDPLHIVSLGEPRFGTLEVISEADMLFRYTPSLNFTGGDSISLIVGDDSSERASNVGFIIIKVVEPDSVSLSNKVSSDDIVLDGDNADWSDLELYRDHSNINESNTVINWLRAGIAHSGDKVYLTYENQNQIEPTYQSGNSLSWGWQTYFNTDGDTSTGFLILSSSDNGTGADYLLEGNYFYKYVGNGLSWEWVEIGVADAQYNGSIAELSFPRNWMTMSTNTVDVVFFGNNNAYERVDPNSWNKDDRYPNADSFSYSFGSGEVGIGTPVSVEQAGLSLSPIAHRPQEPAVTSVSESSESSGGGAINPLLLLLFVLMVFYRRKSYRD